MTSPYNPFIPGGDGMHLDKPVEGGEKARRRRVLHRLVVDGERTFHAYSADELLEIENQVHHDRRPGQAY